MITLGRTRLVMNLGRTRLGAAVGRVVEAVEELVELWHARALSGRGPSGRAIVGITGGRVVVSRRAEGRVHLRREIDDRLTADVDADVAAHELPHIADGLVGARIGAAPRERQRTLEEALQAGGKGGAAANLRDLDHFHEERRQRFGILVGPQVAAERPGRRRRAPLARCPPQGRGGPGHRRRETRCRTWPTAADARGRGARSPSRRPRRERRPVHPASGPSGRHR